MPEEKENTYLLNPEIQAFPEMVIIEGGSFLMGSKEHKSEKTISEVEVSTFYFGKYPITNTQYAAFLNDTGNTKILLKSGRKHHFFESHRFSFQQMNNLWHPAKGYEQHPIINVSWYGAKEYCKWLNKKTGEKYRLPAESEWKFAAKGGNDGLDFPYAGSHKLKEVGWYGQNSYSGTKAVGLKLPNELGLYDLSGNVWEWCEDWWKKGVENDWRVLRGGSWYVND